MFRGERDDTYFFGAARPIVASSGVCYCTGMQEAGVRTSFKFLVGRKILADPVGKRDRDSGRPPLSSLTQICVE
jgi:hypothetical protein